MDKREKLINIIKSAELPQNAETILLAEVDKQAEITDDFIMDVADILDRIGVYLQASGEIQSDYVDQVAAQATKANGVLGMLKSFCDELRSPRESLQMFTASAKPAK